MVQQSALTRFWFYFNPKLRSIALSQWDYTVVPKYSQYGSLIVCRPISSWLRILQPHRVIDFVRWHSNLLPYLLDPSMCNRGDSARIYLTSPPPPRGPLDYRERNHTSHIKKNTIILTLFELHIICKRWNKYAELLECTRTNPMLSGDVYPTARGLNQPTTKEISMLPVLAV